MKQQISALVDNELTTGDTKSTISNIRSHPSVSDVWNTYLLIGDCMRGDPVLPPSFKENLMQKLDAEATIFSPTALISRETPKQSPHKLSRTGIWAIAASVTVVGVLGLLLTHQVTNNSDATTATVADGISSEYVIPHTSKHFMNPHDTRYAEQPDNIDE